VPGPHPDDLIAGPTGHVTGKAVLTGRIGTRGPGRADRGERHDHPRRSAVAPVQIQCGPAGRTALNEEID
jgi:hypothetical protein